MRFVDLLKMANSALLRHKVRAVLTLLGVAIGCFSLAASLSVGQGVEAAVLHLFRQNNRLRKLQLYQTYQVKESEVPSEALVAVGPMDDAKRARLRKHLLLRWQHEHPTQQSPTLTRSRIEAIARMEHVESVVPTVAAHCEVAIGGKRADSYVVGAEPGLASLEKRLVAGSIFGKGPSRGVLIHEGLLYDWGITDDAAVRGIVGAPVRLTFRSTQPMANPVVRALGGFGLVLSDADKADLEAALKVLPEILARSPLTESQRTVIRRTILPVLVMPRFPPDFEISETFHVAGVLREWTEADEPPGQAAWSGQVASASVVLAVDSAVAFATRSPYIANDGFYEAVVTADHEEAVEPLQKRLAGEGLQIFSLAEVIKTVRMNIILISCSLAFIAAVALAVSAIGITNTMVMSVLERTREIGVMKAVGGRDRDIRRLFLLEGGLIGIVGGILGLLLALASSLPGDAFARSIMEQQTHAKLDRSLFAFPLWIVLGVPAISSVITLLAAYYPARRAAGLDPIAALRHE